MLLKKLLCPEEGHVTFACHRSSISEQLTITIKIFVVYSSRLRSVLLQYNHLEVTSDLQIISSIYVSVRALF